jgi:hypothetical protein
MITLSDSDILPTVLRLCMTNLRQQQQSHQHGENAKGQGAVAVGF